MLLLDRIAIAANEMPQRTVISCSSIGEISFSEFMRTSEKVRRTLMDQGIEPGQRIVILMHRSAATVIAMHAILSLGCAYVPIFHGSPEVRLKRLLIDCDPTALICDERARTAANRVLRELDADISVVQIDQDFILDVGDASDDISIVTGLTPEDAFSVMYTSGSTGAPKGVILTHQNLAYYIDWAVCYFNICKDDVIFCTAPFHFDMSSFDIFVALATGARLIIATEKECLFPKILFRKLEREKATVWKAVAPLLSSVAQSVDLAHYSVPGLRVLVFSGDRMPVRDLRTWMAALPNISYFNAYGPTEATGVSCCYRISQDDAKSGIVPIGKGRRDGEVSIFAGDKRIDRSGQSAEIVISGKGIAKGYLGDDERTRRSFVTRIGKYEFPSTAYRTGDLGYLDGNGNVVFVGRSDRQIKHQGYRIELDEIEAVLKNMEGVAAAAVVLIPDGARKGLIAFYEGSEVREADVRIFLSSQLPEYMVPRRVERVSAMPRSDRGKIDYVLLAETNERCCRG